MKEFISAVKDVLTEDEGQKVEDQYIEFKLDDRVLRAYTPTEGQLTFMLAAMGRGQSADSRFASIINIMMETLRDEDKDWFEGRLLTRNPKERLSISTVESIFEYLVEEWFARPTQPSSDSAESSQSDGSN